MKLRHIKQDIIFVFESDKEIKTFREMLKEARKTKLSHQYYFTRYKDIQFSIHNGKPSIHEYYEGKDRSGLLTQKPKTGEVIGFAEYKEKLGYLGVPIVNDSALMKWFDRHLENIEKANE